MDGVRPYFRKRWRLSFSFVCSSCGVYLHDKCPFCKSPVAFFRNDFISKTDIPRRTLDQCSTCGKSLTLAPKVTAEKQEILLQKKFEGYIKTGAARYQPPHFYDAIMHLTWALSTKNPRLSNFQKTIKRINPTKYALPDPRKKGLNIFSLKGIEERMALFHSAFWLLGDFPRRINSILRESNTTKKALLGENKRLPWWFTCRLTGS